MELLTTFRHQTLQLYSKLMPHPCFLCGGLSSQFSICSNCAEDLPRLSHTCYRCALPISQGEICGQCLTHPPPQDHTMSLFRYEGVIKNSVSSYKFRQNLSLSLFFSHVFCERLKQRQDLPHTLIPIPLHVSRLRQRGFNQSALIAKQISHNLNIHYLGNAFTRIRKTDVQHQLNLIQRKRNIKHAFLGQFSSPPAHVAIIDDVMTTGTTVQEAARQLKKSGIKTVEVWTIARAISHH